MVAQSQQPIGEPAKPHPKATPVTAPTGAGTGNAAPAPNPGELTTPPPSPSALFGPSAALTGGSPVLDFFLNTYRTPPFLLPIYLAAAQRYGVPWQVLAAINEVESNYGFDVSTSSAGAEGWMQFLPEEWLAYGVDANGAGLRDPYNPADAIFATARYLAAAGATTNLRDAIYAYNHSSSYVESVMLRGQLIAATPQSLISGLTAIVNGQFPVKGSGRHAVTAVWSKSPQIGAAHQAKQGHSSHAGASAPAPQLAAAASTGATGLTVVGANVAASPGAPVVAVQNAEVIRIGHDAISGHFIELRDAYGDVYTYARLGGVLKRYALPRQSAPTTTPHHARATASAHPALAPLRKGTWVAAGTALASVPGGAPGTQVQFLFQVRPAGAGPIDPRPLLQSWELLGEAQGHPQAGAQPLFGSEAGDALINEIQLLSEHQLQAHLLSDPQLPLSGCQRQIIAAGRLDRPVLTALDFLVSSGLDPTFAAPQCGAGNEATAAVVSKHSGATSVTITALNGVPVRGHDGAGSLAEVAARRLLALPAAIRPHQIVGQLSLPGTAGTLVRPGSPDDVEISFSSPARAKTASTPAVQKPAAEASQAALANGSTAAAAGAASNTVQLDPELGTAQWRKLITRISQLSEPHLPRVPTSAAVPDSPSSPLPAAEPLAGTVPPPFASGEQTGADGHPPLEPRPDGSELGSSGAAFNLAAPLASPLISE